MLRFFRKIRRALLEDGKMRRYILYAIGEILLVMIGILLALQVNNWNQGRQDKILENQYLERLIFEIKKDTSSFKNEIEINENRNKAIRNFIVALDDPNIEESELLSSAKTFFTYGWFLPEFRVAKSTFTDLSSSGQMNLIRNVNLRDQLMAHYAGYEVVLDGFEANKFWLLPLDGTLTIETDALRFDPYSSDVFQDSDDLSDLLENSNMYKRIAAAHYWSNTSAIRTLQSKLEETAQLLLALEKEL